MYPSSFPCSGGPRLLPRHLDLLGAALQRLGGQTHTELARTLAEIAASLVCEAVSVTLTDADARPSRTAGMPFQRPGTRQQRAEPLLNLFGDSSRDYDDSSDDWEEESFCPPVAPLRRPLPSTPEIRSAQLALGLRAASWWLGRTPGATLLPALAFGAATSVAALAGGPLTLVGLELVEALLSIKAMEGASRLAARLLTPSRP